VTLHVKPKEDADNTKDYLETWTLREIIKRYSDFVSYPIYLEEAGKENENDEPVNSMKALWTRPESDVSED
jgi:molecular chaperone HtpG